MPGAKPSRLGLDGFAIFFILEKSLKLLMLDHRDSFTYNLVQLFRPFANVAVHQSGEIGPEEILEIRPDVLCLSPGPGCPGDYPQSKEIVRSLHRRLPILGICLGMQLLNEVFGGRTVRAPHPVHGKRDLIRHMGNGLFEGLPNPLTVARYHSLCIDEMPGCFEANAWASDGVIMAFRHRQHSLFGLQFHPESFLSEGGRILVRNFLETRKEAALGL